MEAKGRINRITLNLLRIEAELVVFFQSYPLTTDSWCLVLTGEEMEWYLANKPKGEK